MPLPPPSATSTALVTGASSGIGADIARELAARGHGVTLVARRADKLQALAGELTNVRVETIACDVADEQARATLFDEVARRGLTIDILVNNAGLGTIGAVATTTVAKELQQVRVNVEAVIDLTTRAVQQLVPRGRGAILNVGSTAGFHPFPGQAGYAATKAFVHSYTEAVRAELAGTGVTVVTLCPGPVRTEFLQRAGMDERTFADAFPKFMWMPSRDVAKVGVDALAGDGGTVIAGLPNKLSTRLLTLLPRRVLLPTLARQHPGLRRDRSA
ncbi:SDR family oxidoreductase [Mycobacterium sp. MYCO198283]|uniref:SDR family NAD(P)-dependent oxidoreductase n=1 Tax=Mycobacterium sp. MYCO198283 TaxID=2883505 RepID=UPI001E4504AD|nr:SDR family oxidoreductase [Mycobacterium sp. MYCO198283]MCG5432253.1 SDR family oxidoreductase [Mycobacterium sp. MYCO198283]